MPASKTYKLVEYRVDMLRYEKYSLFPVSTGCMKGQGSYSIKILDLYFSIV